ncbi:hypothetical protein [Nocardia brasiliensis]|uniref:hypothetical protein n=1 Tax=Nocardia brasiliensis TaxID=37326 RepID=UPI0024559E85|nr:hypothetical protein [Nocardia brasiliensis]
MTPEARVLAEAFADDPLMTFFWPDPDRRRRALPYFWHSRVEARRRKGIVDTASDDTGIVSVVLWDLPGVATPMTKPLSLIRALGRAAPRALATSRQIEGLRPKHPHLYLACGGTLPHARAKGVTAQLVRARTVASRVDVFVIATNDFSATLAEHDGFRPTGELVVAQHVVLRGMLRAV